MARAKPEAISRIRARGLLRSRWSLAMTGLVVTLNQMSVKRRFVYSLKRTICTD
jgi:hypothetical protein